MPFCREPSLDADRSTSLSCGCSYCTSWSHPERWLGTAGFLILRDNRATAGAAPRLARRQSPRPPEHRQGRTRLRFEIFIIGLSKHVINPNRTSEISMTGECLADILFWVREFDKRVHLLNADVSILLLTKRGRGEMGSGKQRRGKGN